MSVCTVAFGSIKQASIRNPSIGILIWFLNTVLSVELCVMYNLNDRELEKATVESPEGDDLSKDPHDSNPGVG